MEAETMNNFHGSPAAGAAEDPTPDQSAAATQGGPALAPGSPAEALLLRMASEYQPCACDPLQGLLCAPGGCPAEAVTLAADAAGADALWSAPFGRVWAMWESGELTQPVFTAYCARAREHRGFSTPWGWQRGAPDWTRGPCCAWEALLCGASPRQMEEWRRWGLIGEETFVDYRQVWRLCVPRFSDLWGEFERQPLRPRAAEALALYRNPVRRAPLDRAAAALRESRRWAATSPSWQPR